MRVRIREIELYGHMREVWAGDNPGMILDDVDAWDDNDRVAFHHPLRNFEKLKGDGWELILTNDPRILAAAKLMKDGWHVEEP